MIGIPGTQTVVARVSDPVSVPVDLRVVGNVGAVVEARAHTVPISVVEVTTRTQVADVPYFVAVRVGLIRIPDAYGKGLMSLDRIMETVRRSEQL